MGSGFSDGHGEGSRTWLRAALSVLAALWLADLGIATLLQVHTPLLGGFTAGLPRVLGLAWLSLAVATFRWGCFPCGHPAGYWRMRIGFAGSVICFILTVFTAAVRLPSTV